MLAVGELPGVCNRAFGSVGVVGLDKQAERPVDVYVALISIDIKCVGFAGGECSAGTCGLGGCRGDVHCGDEVGVRIVILIELEYIGRGLPQ